jgi:hypothetical protein
MTGCLNRDLVAPLPPPSWLIPRNAVFTGRPLSSDHERRTRYSAPPNLAMISWLIGTFGEAGIFRVMIDIYALRSLFMIYDNLRIFLPFPDFIAL